MTRGDEELYLGCYVDDLAIAYGSDAEGSLYHDFTQALKEWQVEDEGEMHNLLGVEISNLNGVVELKQSAYISKSWSTPTFLTGCPSRFRAINAHAVRIFHNSWPMHCPALRSAVSETFVPTRVSSAPSSIVQPTLAPMWPMQLGCCVEPWRSPLPL